MYTFGVRIECIIAILMQKAYMHEQVTKEFAKGKYLNECMPFGYIDKPVVCSNNNYNINLILN